MSGGIGPLRRLEPTKFARLVTKAMVGVAAATAHASPRAAAAFAASASSCGDLRVFDESRIAYGTPVAISWAATRDAPRTQPKRGTAATTHRTAAVHIPKGDLMQLVNFVKSFARNEEGQDLLEYALLVALIALVSIAAVTAAGGSVKTIFTNISNQLNTAASS